MRKLNFLRKSERKSVGTTLALTVGSPSAHRRYSALKHLAFMLLFLLGSLNVWGAETVYKSALFGSSYNSKGVSGYTDVSFSSTNNGFTVDVVNANNNNNGWSFIKIGGKKGAYTGTITTDAAIDKAITKVDLTIDAITAANVTSITLKTSSNGTSWSDAGTYTKETGTKTVTLSSPTSNLYYKIEAVCTQGSSNGLLTISKVEYYAEESGPAQPIVTAAPEEVENVVTEGVENQTISLTYENIENYVTEVTVHPNEDGTGTLSPAWLSASVSDADNYATVTYSVTANEGAARTAYIKVYTTDGENEAEKIIPVSQVKYSAPTGTFELFSGDLEEGDYVLVYATRNNAMKASQEANANRMDYAVVTPSENKIADPDASLVWHIAPISETSYWTIYSAEAEKYVGSTDANNQAKLLSGDLTENMKWTVTSSDGKFDFSNVARVAASGNPYLRNNDNGTNHYGFACYANGTGGALSLYKKQVAGQPKAPTFSVAGGNYESAQSVELSCETEGATIYYTTNGDAPTSSSTQYNGTAIAVDHTMTIKAIAIKNEISSTVASATYTIIVWQTVADVWDDITADGPTNAHIYGYVSQINVGGFDNNFYISDNGSTEGNQLYAYRMNMNSFSVAVGDKVKLAGDLTEYQGTKEFKYANSGATQGLVVALEAKGALQSVAVSGTPTKTEYASSEDFDPAGLKVYGTYANGFVGEITEGITWGNDLTDGKVTENTTVHVTATVNEVASPAYDVAVTVAAKTLVSIAVGTASYTIYTGEVLPKPVVTATFSEGEPEDVSAFAVYDTEDVFNTATIDNPNPQTITVSYTFGGATETVTYTVSVKDYANANDAPYTVTEALHIITDAIGSTESAREIVVAGTVNEDNISNNKNRYKISDGENELLVYAGKGFESAAFTNTNYPKVGDVVKVKGKVINYNNNTPEFASGKSYLLSQVRPATIAIENVASFEVGATDLTESDLDITTPSDGDITFVSGDDAVATIEANAIHAVAPGTVTITANLAATENVDALNYAAASTMFNVTVIAAQVKYAITFNGNGADGGDAPEAIENKAAGAEVTLPANSYTKTGHTFDGWKVINNTTSEEVEVVAGAFTMPASAVTIQAKWAEISEWAVKYTSNVTLTAGTGAQAAKVRFTADGEQYDAVKAGTGKAGGSITVTVPAQATKLHLHVAGWTGENPTISITAPEGVTVTPASISATEDEGMNSNSPFTLKNDPVDQYLVLSLSGNTEEIQLTFSTDAGNKRFALYGVNQEGGVLPVLDHIVVTGTATALEYEVGDVFNPAGLGANAIYTLGGVEQEPVAIDAAEIEWSFEPATIAANTTAVTVTATYEGKSADKEVTGLTVSVPEPEIIVSAASLAFGNKAKGVAVDDKELTVTLKSVENATLTITGDGASAFSVTPALTASGTVAVSANTANVGTFNATLTISDAAGAAEAKTVALSITVEASDDISGTWNLVTDAADLMAGMQVIVASVADGEGNLYTLGGPRGNNGDNRLAVAGTASGNVLTPAAGTKVLTLVDAGDGKYALQLVNGNYLCAASSSSNNLKEQTTNDANGQWTITIADGKATITAQGSYSRKLMRFNPNNDNPLFACYATNSTTGTLVTLYAKPFDYTREIAQGVLSTTCLPNGGKICGASIFEIAYMDYEADGTTPHKIYFDEVEGGIMEAGMPYVVLANEGAAKFGVYYTDSENKAAQSKKGLVGYIGAGKYLEENDYFIYNNMFYYVSATDANNRIHVSSNRAYINLSDVPGYNNEPVSVPAPGRRRVSLGNGANAPQVATGIENTGFENEAPRKVLINGELFILRGEKMYDATGRLVK